MFLRFAMIALIATGLSGMGMFAWLALHQAQPAIHTVVAASAEPAPQHLVVIAAHPLRAGSLLKPEDLDQKDFALQDIPPGSTQSTPATRSMLYGAMVRRSIAPGEPILPQDIVRPGEHGFLAAVLAPGMRAVTIDFSQVASSINLIWPGDHVDMVLTQEGGADVTAARRIFGETVLTDIRVLAIDQQMIQGASAADTLQSGPRSLTVEVTPEGAERLAVVLRLGRIAFSVRSAEQPRNLAQSTGVAPTIWAGDVSPALARATPANVGSVVHVWQGSDDAKEFRY